MWYNKSPPIKFGVHCYWKSTCFRPLITQSGQPYKPSGTIDCLVKQHVSSSSKTCSHPFCRWGDANIVSLWQWYVVVYIVSDCDFVNNGIEQSCITWENLLLKVDATASEHCLHLTETKMQSTRKTTLWIPPETVWLAHRVRVGINLACKDPMSVPRNLSRLEIRLNQYSFDCGLLLDGVQPVRSSLLHCHDVSWLVIRICTLEYKREA